MIWIWKHVSQEAALEAVACLRNLAFSRAGALLLIHAGKSGRECGGDGRAEGRGEENGRRDVMSLLEHVLDGVGEEGGSEESDSGFVEYGRRIQYEALAV